MKDSYEGVRGTSALSDEAKAFLAEVLPPERDKATGKFKRGKLGGPGRTQSSHGVYNFNKLVCEYVERNGNNIEAVVAELFEDLMEASHNGDTAASKFLTERLCGKEATQIDMAVTTTKLSEPERIARLTTLLAAAARRKQEGPDVRRN